MEKLNLLIVFMLLFCIQILPQNWPTAPEVWSEPVLFDSLFNTPNDWLESPCFTNNLDTLYLDKSDGIHRSVKINGKWQPTTKLNSYINPGGVATRYCSISRDGRRLYFAGWGGYGSWDIWKSEFDTVTNDWGPAYNMGPVVNTTDDDSYLYEVNKDTIFTTSGIGHPDLFAYNNNLGTWAKIDSFWYHQIGGARMSGLSLTKNNKKMYFGKKRWEEAWGYDLCVTYWDPLIKYWGNTYYLNINTQTSLVNNIYKGGVEFYPWISENGKMMLFASNRNVPVLSNDNSTKIFISYLLIDENGDTVTTVNDNNTAQIKSFRLEQNYPNPFNPSTTIKYTVANEGNVKIIIYDSIGRKITELLNEYKTKGEYKVKFDAQKYKLASGTYYYQLINNNDYLVKKMILTK